MQTPEEEIEMLRRQVIELQLRVDSYEMDGVAKLFYALQRKGWEMADVLNNIPLHSLDLSDSKDKRFERLRIIWDSATAVSGAIKTLGELAGATGNEGEDTKREVAKIYGISPESISNALSNR